MVALASGAEEYLKFVRGALSKSACPEMSGGCGHLRYRGVGNQTSGLLPLPAAWRDVRRCPEIGGRRDRRQPIILGSLMEITLQKTDFPPLDLCPVMSRKAPSAKGFRMSEDVRAPGSTLHRLGMTISGHDVRCCPD
jgi:hypothetical protein